MGRGGRLPSQEAVTRGGPSSVSGEGGGKEVEKEAVWIVLSGNSLGRRRKSRSQRSPEAWKRCLSS